MLKNHSPMVLRNLKYCKIYIMNYISTIILSYLVGCFSTAFYLVKHKTGVDIRTHATGNAGATNAGRLLGTKYYVIIALTDVVKGAVAVLIALSLAPDPARFVQLGTVQIGTTSLNIAAAMVAVVLGHIFPVQLKFRGGQGIATAGGAVFAINPPTMLFFLAAYWVLRKVITNKDVAGLAAVLSIPVLFYICMKYMPFMADNTTFVGTLAVSLMAFGAHFIRKKAITVSDISQKEND